MPRLFESWPGRGPGRAPDGSPASRRLRPAQAVTLAFLGTIALGTLLLSTPLASAAQRATFVEALFTATSATCVTGLVVVDTEVFWTPFGQAVILVLIQLGGLGVMTVASLLGLLLTRRLGLSSRLVAAKATSTVGLGDVRQVIVGALRLTLVVEAVVALAIALRMVVTYDASAGHAVWSGVFHAVSAFNNAGFSIYGDSLVRFVVDPLVCLPICLAVVVGGLGYPVLLELWRLQRLRGRSLVRPARWTLHSRLTIAATIILLIAGTLFFLAAEWGNSRTFGPLDPAGKVLAAFTQAVMPRTAGFNTVSTADLNNGTLLFTDVLMFVGGGSAGTAGGIKVGTFIVLAFVIWSELRGDPDVTVVDRRLSGTTQRQAITVALLGMAAVMIPTLVMTVTTRAFSLDQMLFEVTSAFTTTGLSTGITADLPEWHQLILVVLMFVGRLGPITLGTSLALRERRRLYRRPEGPVIIG